MRLSCEAIEFQSGGNIHSDPTIQTYWDAGRLDLVRVGIRTGAKLMSALAGMMIDDAERVRVFRIETFGIVPADALARLSRNLQRQIIITHRCHILETGNDSFRFKASSAVAARKRKEPSNVLAPA